MPERPYVLLSCAVSLDGCLDDTRPARLILSNEQDLDLVDAERASADAILVGATTIRRDDPRLLVRDAARRRERARAGRPASPAKVTVTRSGELDSGARFFAADGTAKLVYCYGAPARSLADRLDGRAEVVEADGAGGLGWVLEDLARRGVRRLMVEGGSEVLTALLADALADELRLAIAPVLVGDPAAPRFRGVRTRTSLLSVEDVGGMAVLRYRLGTEAR
ncbi:MAG: RibD family protein [Acidothermales bacterium]|nr:RibD family protein [Acidothermales bacterium]